MAFLSAEAVQALDKQDKCCLESLVDRQPTRLEDVVFVVDKKRQEYLDSRLQIKTQSGKVIYVRDMLDGIAGWLDKFKQIGDVAIQVDQIHAAPAWAVVRFLLQSVVADSQSFASVAQGVEMTMREASTCAAIEACMLGDRSPMTELRSKLRDSLIQFYTSVLVYLVRAAKYYSTSTARRFLKALARPVPALADRLKALQERAMTVQVLVNDNVAELAVATDYRTQNILNLLRSYDEKLWLSHDALQALDQQRRDRDNVDFHNWISDIPYWRHHDDSLRDLTPDTSTWLQRTSQYMDFIQSTNAQIFWLRGGSGYGKTKLMSVCIDAAIESMGQGADCSAVAYFYASKNASEASRSDAEQVLRALTRQAVLACPKCLAALEKDYHNRKTEAAKNGTSVATLTSEEAIQYLVEVAEEKSILFMVDGLDEMSHDAIAVFRSLRRVMTRTRNVVKIMIASRPILGLDFEEEEITVHDISSEDCVNDIVTYLHFAVPRAVERKELLRGRVSQGLQVRIVQELSSQANGMFLWAKLQLMNFCMGNKFKVAEDIVTQLTKPSESMTAVYDAMYKSFGEYEASASQILQSTLAWLLASQRPLETSELLFFVGTGLDCELVSTVEYLP